MSIPYEEYARDVRDEWNDAEADARDEAREINRQEKVAENGCQTCEGRKRVPCACNFVDNGFDGCDECDGTSFITCEDCDGERDA